MAVVLGLIVLGIIVAVAGSSGIENDPYHK